METGPVLDYDYLIIGSGFGGSVSALRLAEKGWNVAVVEQGRRIGKAEIEAGKSGMFKLLWMPPLGLRGYFVRHMFRHVTIVGGVGVGGGGIVWGAVTLGPLVRTNSEAIAAVLHRKGDDMSDGTAISTDFHPDANTHATQNRFDRGYRFMRFYMGPMVDGPLPWRRAIRTVVAIVLSPLLMLTNALGRNWEKRITAFTIMQDLDNHIRLQYRRPWWWPFAPKLVSEASPGHEAPSYLPVANRLTREFAAISGGTPMNITLESLGGQSTTAHILCGCPMGRSAQDGVIDTRHEVDGHPGLYVVDGSSIPGNIGVNPGLSITAMAERFAALQPART